MFETQFSSGIHPFIFYEKCIIRRMLDSALDGNDFKIYRKWREWRRRKYTRMRRKQLFLFAVVVWLDDMMFASYSYYHLPHRVKLKGDEWRVLYTNCCCFSLYVCLYALCLSSSNPPHLLKIKNEQHPVSWLWWWCGLWIMLMTITMHTQTDRLTITQFYYKKRWKERRGFFECFLAKVQCNYPFL